MPGGGMISETYEQCTNSFSPPFAWYAPTLAAASRLLQLPDIWDQYGAQRVKSVIVQAAMTLLNGIMLDDTPASSVVPTIRRNPIGMAHAGN